jgi:hypothetical protein
MFNVLNLHEYVGNLHMHTPYSDGEASHQMIAEAALRAGLDFVVVTDHNLLVCGVEGYYGNADQGHVLLLVGEEIHDQARQPQANHLLVFGAGRELAQYAFDPQVLIDEINAVGGMSFLAHPNDQTIQWLGEVAIPWEDWHVERFTGLEIWNYMSSAKDLMPTPFQALRMAFRPDDLMSAPNPKTLALWDSLTAQGRRVVGIGNADAHGTTYHAGPISHVVYPYDFLFSCVNTHVLLPQPLAGDLDRDKAALYRALRAGNAFISYDLVGDSRGFRFSAHGQTATMMGGTIRLGTGVTLQAKVHERCHLKMIHQGKVVAEVHDRENLTYTAHNSGAYRVEAWRDYKGQERAWILSNPIYIEDNHYRVVG